MDGKDYLSEVKELIQEYSRHLGRDLSFQNIEDELKDPSHKYTAPEGELLVAIEGEKWDKWLENIMDEIGGFENGL